MSKIQVSEDYSSFKRIKGNRSINKKQVQKLYTSFNDNPEIATAVPIIINDKREIIDGQHRFEAWKRLKLPIYYLQTENLRLQDVQTINSSTKVWSPIDYARSFSEIGNNNYKIYLDFKNTYHLSHAVLILFLSDITHRGGGSTSHSFRKGKFKAGDTKKAAIMAEQLLDFGKLFKAADNRIFAVAFKKLVQSKGYDHQRMLEKIKKHGARMLKPTPYSEEYMRQLERIFNHRMGESNRVKLF